MFKRTKLSLPNVKESKDDKYLETLKAWSFEKEELSLVNFYNGPKINPKVTRQD